MRICLYTETFLPKIGGQELVVDALARTYTALGHETVVLTQPPRKNLPLNDGEFPYRVVRHPRFLSRRFFVAWYRRYLQNLHRRFPFDVVHCHSVYPCGYVACLAQKTLATPVVLTSHGDVRADNPRFRKSGLRGRHEQAVAAADAVTSISRFTTDGYLQLGADPHHIHEIPNGVDTAAYRQPVARPNDVPPACRDRNYLLFLGRLHRRKGVDVLLDAQARRPATTRLPLIIAGDGEERPNLERQAADLKLTDCVTFVGGVSGDKKRYLLQNARAVVQPSREWEAFPLVVLESYAAGTPMIGSQIHGLDRLIEPERTGLLVAAESADELQRALARAESDAVGFRAFGEAAAKTADDYDWRAVAGRYLALFDRLIAARRRGVAA